MINLEVLEMEWGNVIGCGDVEMWRCGELNTRSPKVLVVGVGHGVP